MIEQLLFITFSLILFGVLFFKMLKNNDSEYVVYLLIQSLGIILDAIYIITGKIINKGIIYLLSIILPIFVLILEYKRINLIDKIRILRAKLYFYHGKYKKSKQILVYLTDKNINNYEAHRLLAEVYEKEGGLRKAIDEYVYCIDINKKDYDSYYKVSKLLVELNKKDEAIEMLYNLLTKKPDYLEATIELSNLLIENNNFKDALVYLTDSLKYYPESFDLNYELGMVYTMLNDFANAKIYYDKSAMLNSLNYCVKYNLAQIALLYKDYDKAEQYFEETINNDDLQADSYYELAKIKLLRGDKSFAIKYINIAIDMESKRISEKVKKETIFIPIMARISIPFNLEEKQDSGLSERDIKVKEHLENIANITMNMGYVNFMKKDDKFKNRNGENEKINNDKPSFLDGKEVSDNQKY